MREIYKFEEERFINFFVSDLKVKAVCFTDIDFTMEYIDKEIKPMINVVDFMFVHHFISEEGYFKCKNIYEKTINRGKEALIEKYRREADEENKKLEQRKTKEIKYAVDFINTHKIGDKVKIKGTLIGTNLPRYIEGGYLTIVGFTKRGNVKCRWDEKSVFSIPPIYLKDV